MLSSLHADFLRYRKKVSVGGCLLPGSPCSRRSEDGARGGAGASLHFPSDERQWRKWVRPAREERPYGSAEAGVLRNMRSKWCQSAGLLFAHAPKHRPYKNGMQ
jgi:hypothetical protein